MLSKTIYFSKQKTYFSYNARVRSIFDSGYRIRFTCNHKYQASYRLKQVENS